MNKKEAEEKFRSFEKKSHAWLEHSPVCTKVVDLDFNLQYMSASGIRDLKIDDITEYYGKPYPLSFYPESFKESMTKRLMEVKETAKVAEQEAAIVDTEGNEAWFHSTLVPVLDDNGDIEYIMIVSINITDRKKAEVGLKDRNEELEKFHKITIGRENMMIKLKEKIKDLETQK